MTLGMGNYLNTHQLEKLTGNLKNREFEVH